MSNPIFTQEVMHLAHEILQRYEATRPTTGKVFTKSGRLLASSITEFCQMAIQRRWIGWTADIQSIPMTDCEYAVDWDRIARDQERAAARRRMKGEDGRVAQPSGRLKLNNVGRPTLNLGTKPRVSQRGRRVNSSFNNFPDQNQKHKQQKQKKGE